MYIEISQIISKTEQVIKNSNSRDPYKIAEDLGIIILERPFKKQYGVYQKIENYAFIFLKEDLDLSMNRTVLLHEIGHHVLHWNQIESDSINSDSNLFGINNRMEYEANLFAANVAIADEEILELIQFGYDINQIAHALGANPNLVALKVELLNKQGYKLNRQNFESKFLKSK